MDPILQQLQQEIGGSLRGLDATQTQLRPSAKDPDKWSIQQIAQHLALTYANTEIAINGRLVKGTPTRTQSTLQQHIRPDCAYRSRRKASDRHAGYRYPTGSLSNCVSRMG